MLIFDSHGFDIELCKSCIKPPSNKPPLERLKHCASDTSLSTYPGELYYKTKRQHLLYKCGYIGEYLWEQLLPQNDKELERFAIWHKM